MSEEDLQSLLLRNNVAPLRIRIARWVESRAIQGFVLAVIIFNSVLLGLETSDTVMQAIGPWLITLDRLCLAVFIIELSLKLFAYRLAFWRNGWNVFDFLVVAVALAPGAGPWSVLRSLRVLRVFRLLTAIPAMRKVVAAFLHSIPGLGGVIAVMLIFFYTAAVLATNLFGDAFPAWFGTLGRSLYSLFQIMTLESWSMGIVRPILEVFPWAWAFFVPFIMIATFTILNLFIGIIVSTMQELTNRPATPLTDPKLAALLSRMESDLSELRSHIEKAPKP